MAKKEREDNTGLFIPAGLFLGLGYGALSGHWLAGLFFGLGAGFVTLAVARLLFGRK
jgi:hypothetical protein